MSKKTAALHPNRAFSGVLALLASLSRGAFALTAVTRGERLSRLRSSWYDP